MRFLRGPARVERGLRRAHAQAVPVLLQKALERRKRPIQRRQAGEQVLRDAAQVGHVRGDVGQGRLEQLGRRLRREQMSRDEQPRRRGLYGTVAPPEAGHGSEDERTRRAPRRRAEAQVHVLAHVAPVRGRSVARTARSERRELSDRSQRQQHLERTARKTASAQ